MKIGILGGGQLAAMMAQAGAPLGMDFVFLDPAADACAGHHGQLLVDDWASAPERTELAACDRLTCDFENVSAEVLEALAERQTVRPAPSAFAAAQDRLTEKQLFEELEIPLAPFAAVDSRPELLAALERIGYPAVLKTRRFGYDGKGQAVLRGPEDLEPAWAALGGNSLVLEGWVPFEHECALTAVRSASGEVRFYPPSWTLHADGILRVTLAPGRLPEPTVTEAQARLKRLLDHLDYVGCLTLELFAADSGLLANEFAPRVHNSAHWTIEGAETSQFENHLRAVADLPLGSTAARGESIMLNWIGALPSIERLLEVPGLSWHDYRKQARPGRKVGHATIVAADRDQLIERVETVKSRLDRQWAPWLDRALGALG
ncbi:5-(carboxyamino)imidazole ribonucleotide synthase [Wenzhouxiangella marina]|uniref:N5-carboxyaminoimidazole ribonucleotide synthase n=1 Tax=Wenzhouxiangella marina TaxID=1579979 RepID=A0A0K0XVB8_9GAMM|nr:5-(carboxyamino)imidazole ribonucleotide synthase [Wenzhouxiangella marina]AKS41654.1 N5-carboxyaminoimidazole ribonucleotide synthase [Wenzhouxiangella marina]MBB6086586.1 5-(carboxyamino)imidazole ribonucleotide synthase [Wenzhouxiangella marina]